MLRTLVIGVALVLVMGACGSSGNDGGAAGGKHDMSDMGGSDDMGSAGGGASFGEAGSAGDADRTIEVTALDQLEFDPASVTAKAGETINFVVTNEGKAPHEFVIGDFAYQEAHEQKMGGGGHGDMMDNVLELDAGETKEIAWTFTEAGEVLFACHVEGHYEGGMVGTVTVE